MGKNTFLLCFAALVCSACPFSTASKSAQKSDGPSIRDFELGQKTIYAKRATEAQQCIDPTGEDPEGERSCQADVAKRWRPTLTFLATMRSEWCAEHKGDCESEGPQEAPPEAQAEAERQERARQKTKASN